MNPTEDVPAEILASPGGGPPPAPDDPRVVRALEEYSAALKAGQRPDRHALLTRHADIAAVLAECLDGLEFIQAAVPHLHESASVGADTSRFAPGEVEPEAPLGDYRIVREIGRGGMGVVYEAVQLSLGRRVALKVLPFAATLDAKQLQRFKNEAQAAAGLHHTNIVPVYFVGCERGVHFYAMQFIDGHTLAALIHELRQRAGLETTAATASLGAAPAIAGQATGPYAPVMAAADTARQPAAALSTEHSTPNLAFLRTAAQLGIQAAEALEHAHQLGVVHRDVKPANLLVDGRGKLWITDFGLAHCQSQAGLTMTGDLIGTLRYMSPEQALAQRVLVDHRTDIYSLGVTLYELLTLQPVFDGRDRQELLRQIAFEEPRPPRRLTKAIPRELETIVLKAMAKNPAERYGTAQEVADDLERYLKDEPIRARRPTLVQKVKRWSRRHRQVVWTAAAGLLVAIAVLAGSIGWIVRDRAAVAQEVARDNAARQARLEESIRQALDEAQAEYERDKLPRAIAAVKRAEGLLASGDVGSNEIRQRVDEWRAELRILERLEELGFRFSRARARETDAAYSRVFLDIGININELPVEEAGRRIRSRLTWKRLTEALDRWVGIRHELRILKGFADNGFRGKNHLLQVARAADTDDLRSQARLAVEKWDLKAAKRLAESPEVSRLPASILRQLAMVIYWGGGESRRKSAVRLLENAQAQRPGDFQLSLACANYYAGMDPPRWAEAAHYWSVALAIRPDDARVHVTLGLSYQNQAKFAEAATVYHRAIELDPQNAGTHVFLGNALGAKGQLDQAIAEYREAIRLEKDFALAHNNLGNTLRAKAKLDEAIAEGRVAIRLKKDFAEAHYNLGLALLGKGQRDEEAIAEFREAIRLKKNLAEPHYTLGNVLCAKGQLDEAIGEFREAIRLKKDDPHAHYTLGLALVRKQAWAEATAAFKEVVRLDPKRAWVHNYLAWLLATCPDARFRDPARAVQLAKKAVELQPKDGSFWNTLGVACYRAGDGKVAITALMKSMELRKGGGASDWYFLAMAHWQLGDKEKARKWYDQAVQWMEKNQGKNEELGHFRAEAEMVLELKK